MAALIASACDICGHIHNLAEDRLGDVVSCRECGTKFEVVEFVPHPEEESEAASHDPLVWIKGAGVTLLILAVLVGLSSLLVYRPEPSTRQVSDSGWFRRRAVPNRRAVPDARAVPDPRLDFAEHQRLQRELERSRRVPQPSPQVPVANIPENNAAAPPQPAIPAGPVPQITDWNAAGPQSNTKIVRSIRFAGTGLSSVTKVRQSHASGVLFDAEHTIASDTELTVNLHGSFHAKESLFLFSNPAGMTVVFSEEIPAFDNQQVLSGEPRVYVCVVRAGGHVVSQRPLVALVEAGGCAEIRSLAMLSFARQGAELKVERSHKLFAEPGAKITMRNPGGRAEPPQRSIQFCRLPPFSVSR